MKDSKIMYPASECCKLKTNRSRYQLSKQRVLPHSHSSINSSASPFLDLRMLVACMSSLVSILLPKQAPTPCFRHRLPQLGLSTKWIRPSTFDSDIWKHGSVIVSKAIDFRLRYLEAWQCHKFKRPHSIQGQTSLEMSNIWCSERWEKNKIDWGAINLYIYYIGLI